MLCLSGFELYARWVPLFRLRSADIEWKIAMRFKTKQTYV